MSSYTFLGGGQRKYFFLNEAYVHFGTRYLEWKILSIFSCISH